MAAEPLTPEDIKRIRKKYDLSQKAFAQLLGIGEASMARYESGTTPSKANANLIRAAEEPKFMLDCLRRDGELLTERQREHTEDIVYAMISFDEKGDVMDINEIYMLTLEQEILNEQAAEVIGDLIRMIIASEKAGDAYMAKCLDIILTEVTLLKSDITAPKTDSIQKVTELKGRILSMRTVAEKLYRKAA